jgi:heptosyltransferase III
MTMFAHALEHFFRKNIVYPLLRMIFRNHATDDPMDLSHVSRILIFRYDRIGDMIITTPVLRALKEHNPNIRLDVLASKSNAEIVQHNPFVDNLLILESNWAKLFSQIIHLRKQRYDVVINLIFNRTTGPGILANLVAPDGFKIGQGPDRYAFYFNRLVKVRRFEQHMLESYVSLIEQAFGISINHENLRFDVTVGAEAKKAVDEWLKKNSLGKRSQPESMGKHFIVLNPSAKDEDRSLGVHQAVALAKSLSGRSQFRLVLLDSPGNAEMSGAIRNRPEFKECLVYQTRSLQPLGELASLIGEALLVISPDTSIVHFASAMQTPVLAIYAPVNASQEWLPFKVPYDVVMAEGSQRISEIKPEAIVEGFDKFLARVLGMRAVQTPEMK